MAKPHIFLVTLSALLLICLQACTNDPAPTSTAEKELTENQKTQDIEAVEKLVEDVFQIIWSDLDTGRILDFHTEDFTLLEDGLVWNNDSIRHYLTEEMVAKEEYQYERKNRFKFIDARHRGESIWIAYENYGSWTTGEKILGIVQWMESAVAVQQDSIWKLELLHSTRMEN